MHKMVFPNLYVHSLYIRYSSAEHSTTGTNTRKSRTLT